MKNYSIHFYLITIFITLFNEDAPAQVTFQKTFGTAGAYTGRCSFNRPPMADMLFQEASMQTAQLVLMLS